MDNKNNGVEVSYNVQTAVDAKHKLIVAFDVTNNPADQGNLNTMAEKAKEVFGKEEIEALADKGYYQAEDLKKCEQNKTTTYVTKQSFSNSTGDRDFYGDRFIYDKEKDLYICPAGKELHRIKHKTDNPKRIRYRNYDACKNCQYKERCTKSQNRKISTTSDDSWTSIWDN